MSESTLRRRPRRGAPPLPGPGRRVRGTLEELVLAAQRGDVDLRDLPVAQVTTQVSRQLTGSELGGDLRDAAEALGSSPACSR